MSLQPAQQCFSPTAIRERERERERERNSKKRRGERGKKELFGSLGLLLSLNLP
jgi:hypothetical protein